MGTSYIDNLLSKIDDESLRTRLTNEINKLRDNKKFGLVFERHIPEYVRLYKREITEGAHVQLRSSKSDEIFTVSEIKGKKAKISDKNGSMRDEKMDEREDGTRSTWRLCISKMIERKDGTHRKRKGKKKREKW